MKFKLLMMLCTLSCSANQFTSLLLPPEFSKDAHIIKERQNLYRQLLPTIDNNEPDLFFIRSREPLSMSLESAYLSMIESAFMPANFVETGTYLGDSTLKAATQFQKVYSIELSPELFKKAQTRFKKNSRITLYQGDSCEQLPHIISEITGKTVYFLDAHYSLGQTAQGSQNTPILAELACIQKAGITDAIIIIDDIRMFYTPRIKNTNSFIDGYPNLNQIVETILSINSTYQCACIYDTLVAFPADEKITVSPVVQAITMSRLYDGNNYDQDELIKAELCIAKAVQDEKIIIEDLALTWTEPWSLEAGLSRHNPLWYGLSLLYNQAFAKALTYFTQAQQRGLNDWRIEWYITMAQAECFFDMRPEPNK
jgi:hypothetical protein